MGKSQYIIQFGGLPIGIHDFEFEVDDSFFKKFETSEITSAAINIDAQLTKQNNLLQLHLEIYGTLGLECDRCVKYVDFPIETEEDLVIKHGNPIDSTDEILIIPEGQEEFELSQYLYEYITLAIPSRRVPCELDAKMYACDNEMLAKINLLATDKETNNEEPTNPLWEQLNKIKKFNQN
jgi:uncharacterized protein